MIRSDVGLRKKNQKINAFMTEKGLVLSGPLIGKMESMIEWIDIWIGAGIPVLKSRDAILRERVMS